MPRNGVKRRFGRHQKARRVNNIEILAYSAKPPSRFKPCWRLQIPVQIRRLVPDQHKRTLSIGLRWTTDRGPVVESERQIADR